MFVRTRDIDERTMLIFKHIHRAGGSPFIIGGAARARVMKAVGFGDFDDKDIDIEVFGISAENLIGVLETFGSVGTFGKSFAVIKLRTPDGAEFDFNLPRIDIQTGDAHTDVDVIVDVDMSLEQAVQRRDFTMNALMIAPETGEVIDLVNGIEDIKNGIIRHVSDETFGDDALRALRAFQFAGRFSMTIAPETLAICNSLKNKFWALPQDRIWLEWQKWAAKSIKPSKGLQALKDMGWLEFFPQVAALDGCPQDPIWHKEGDVFVHTQHCLDAMTKICDDEGVDEETRMIRMFGILGHDFGKPETTKLEDGRWHAKQHDSVGVQHVEDFMLAIGVMKHPNWKHILDTTKNMCKLHMRHIGFKGSKSQVARIALQISMRELAAVVAADHSGRPFVGEIVVPDEMLHMLEVAKSVDLENKKPQPILMGRHLVAGADCWLNQAMKPGPRVGSLLSAAFEAQLNFEFTDEVGAKEWLLSHKFDV